MEKLKKGLCSFLVRIKKAKAETFAAFAAAFFVISSVIPAFATTTSSGPDWNTIITGITSDLSAMLTSALPPLFGIFAIFLGVRIVRRLISRFTRV